ncbi:LPD38 domain-containing protein [Histophilus somni]|uniref:MuF-C-terminal domain-containing protein n=1 Tax=Histophilus somni TaxID=731 RepID=UPI0014191842|nr:LPD38 domain-containing protein [Histophilus somni]
MSDFSLSNEEFQYLQKNILGIAPNATGSRGRGQSDVADEGSSSIDVIANQYKLPEEQGFFADVVDSVQMGAWRGAGDLARGIGALFNSEWLNKAADYAYYNAEENKATMSSKMQEALGQSAFDGWNEETGEGKGLLNMYWWAGNLGALLGENIDTVLTMGAGKLATTGIKAGGKLAGKYFSKEVADQVGKAAVKQASRFGIPAQYHKTIAYTAIASAMSAGNRANQVREELSQISDNDLAQHNDFRIAYWDLKESDEGQTLSDHEIFEQARQQYYNKVGRDAILNPLAIAADITANAVGGLGGGLWGLPKVNKWLGKPTQNIKEGVLKGAFIESATEGLQGAAEQYAINDTARDYYDSDRSLTEGMSENIADGMVLGAGFGGMTGGYEAMSHRRTMNREKKRLLEAVNTGDERVDAQIRYQVEAYNKIANDLDELISPQRIQTLNQFGLQAVEKARRREQIEAELRGETQAQAEKQQAEQVQTVTDTPYHQRNLADIQAEFIQHGLDENDFNDFLEANLQQATADLQKLQANPFKMGTDLQKSLAEKQAYNAKLADTQARVDYWTQAKTAPKFGTEATQAESAVQAESKVQTQEQVTPDELKLSRSAPQETQSFYETEQGLSGKEGEFSVNNDDIRFSKALQKPERLEKLRQAKPIEITGKEIEPSDDLRQYKRNALEYGKSLRGSYVNKDTGKAIELGAGGVKEILQHDYKDIEHLQSIAAVPQIIENAIYIDTLPNEDKAKNFAIDGYEYYLAGLKIGGVDYTVRAVVGVTKDGNRYYDHKLTKIEKGELLSLPSRITNPVGESSSPLSSINDKRLLQILQQQTKSFDFSQEKSQIAEAVGKGLSTHFEVVHSSELGINDPTIEAAYNTKTGKIVIIADNIRANDILTREERLKWVAWHELAHRGLQVRFGKEFKALMEQADRNTTVRDLATALQKDRAELRDNRTLAVEEAIAELHAAYTTGKMEELKSRYGLVVPRGREISLKSWFRITAERIREFMVKLFGREKANRFSHDDLLNLLKDIQQSAGGDIHESDNNTRYSLNEDPNSSFAKAVEAVANNGRAIHKIINVGTTPDVLKMLGLPNVDVVIHANTLSKVMQNKHNVTAETLKQLPKQINDPVAVMKSETQPNGYVVLTELIEQMNDKNKPVIAALHLKHSNQGLELINIASVYGRSNSQIQRGLEKDLLYWNKEKGAKFLDNFTLQLRSSLSGNSSIDGNIKTETDLSQYQNFNSAESDFRLSRSSTYQSGDNISVLELSRGGNIQAPKWTDKFSTLQALKETFHQGTAKLDEWFADSLRPVNDWIDNMQFSDHTSNKSGRDHEKRRLKDAMYTAKGRRDALNSEFEVHYLNPILSKIAEIAKRSQGKINEETAKRKAGFWVSARYSIEKNMELLSIDEKAMQEAQKALDDAKINGTVEDIRKAKNAFNSAQKHYLDRKAAVWNKDFNNKHFKAGVAGGWSIPEAQEIMRNIERDISIRDLTTIGDLIAELNQARLEIDYKSGRLTDTEYQQFKANRHYVPLTGDPNAQLDDMDFIAGAGANSLNIAKDKALKGRTNSEAEDAIDAIWKAVGKSTTYAGWSEFKGKLDALLETEVSLLEQQGYSNVEAQRLAGQNLGIGKQKMQGLTRSSDNVLIARRGGVYYEYSLPDRVISALKNDNVEQANDFLKVLSKPTRWYARGVTQWSLAFAPINMLRDTWEKSEFIRVQKVYDRQGKLLSSDKMDQIGRATALSPLTNPAIWAATKRFAFGQELRDSVLEEKLLKQLLKEGAISTYGTYLERTEADLLKRIKRENSVLGSKIDKAMGVIESYNQTFDMVSALSAYKALVDNGVDSKQAAATTLELTNFRKTGSKMRGIKALYMFSQPTVMGAANLIRYLSTKKGQIRFLTYTAGMMALYSLLRSMDDEDEAGNKMDQLGDITRFIPIPIGNGNYIKLPVGFGMPQMAWNFATNIVKGAVSDISFMEAGVNMVTHATKTFAPVSPSEISALKYPLEKLALTFTPSILQPLMQNALNRSAFGSQITTNFVRQDKLKAEQSKSTTAQFWKDLAIDIQQTLGLDMHPEQIKNLFDGYSGMLGSLKELNTWLVENPNREQLGRNTRTLFINQLYGAGNEFAVQSRYYEASEEAQQVAKEYAYRKLNKQLDREWLTPERQELIKWHEYNLRTMGKLRSEKAQLTKQLRAGKISAHAYEQRLKRYNEAVNSVQKKLLSGYRQMVGLSSY